MNKNNIEEFRLIGLKLDHKTTNEHGQSGIDCGNLWQRFERENYADKIPGKLSNEIYAVYFEYEGDYTKPFSYFIGCKVNKDTKALHNMDGLLLPSGIYAKVTAKGKIPDCITNTWKDIWSSDIKRSYHYDFEVYDERSRDWRSAEIDIFISVAH